MIHTNIIARIERYSGGTADLEPLFLDDAGKPYEKIVNARTLDNKTYEKGDIVLVAITERDFSDAIDGRVGNGGNYMKHDLSSAVVVGRVT